MKEMYMYIKFYIGFKLKGVQFWYLLNTDIILNNYSMKLLSQFQSNYSWSITIDYKADAQ